MLHLFSDLRNSTLAARDGEIGRVQDFYFDDRTWRGRYVVVNTGSWLLGRRVLLPPQALKSIDLAARKISVDLTLEQIENSPSMDAEKPLSRQHEAEWLRYYGSSNYWLPEAAATGAMALPVEPPPLDEAEADPHLRSAEEVSGYAIHATDGDIGRAEDFLFDDQTWHVRYLVILRSWWAGTRVILAPDWIQNIDWDHMKVSVDLSRDTIREAPVWAGREAPGRGFEDELHRYYQRRAYWHAEGEPAVSG